MHASMYPFFVHHPILHVLSFIEFDVFASRYQLRSFVERVLSVQNDLKFLFKAERATLISFLGVCCFYNSPVQVVFGVVVFQFPNVF